MLILVKFHQSHYHPSNAVVMSFGNIPVAETQARIHEDALAVAGKTFAKRAKHASRLEKSLTAPISVTDTYSVDTVNPKQTHRRWHGYYHRFWTVNSAWLCDYLKAYWLNMQVRRCGVSR